eukprot:SAG22_NODE_232_length_14402_cov_58.042159_2_plen_579_part_00
MGCGAAEQDLSAVFKRLDSLDQQLHKERQDKAALRAELADERRANLLQARQIAALQAALHEFTNKTEARLDQCEAGTHPFIGEMERRRMQDEDEETLCRGSGLSAMFASCCPTSGGNGGHRRFLQSQGCDVLPDTCPSDCAPLFIEFFEGCQGMINDLNPAEQQEMAGLYADCSEVQQQSAMANLQPVDVKMFRITINQEVEQQAAMANSGSTAPSPPFGPVVLPPGGSSPTPGSDEATDVEQYHAQCTTANILTCVPACNATHHGFELLATIDGTDTKFSCNLANQLFSWVGAAALGGFLGQNVAAFVSAVISGAAGTYVLTLTEDADVGTDLVVQPGQNVIISGDVGLAEALRWGTGGFTVGEMGSLSLSYVHMDATSAIAVTVGGSLSLANLALPAQVLATALDGMSGAGSRLTLETVTVVDYPEWGTLTGTVTAGADAQPWATTGNLPPFFVVLSGPCTTAVVDGHFCVGRWPGGYGPNEDCAIAVAGGASGAAGGVLSGCPVFDTDNNGADYLTLPDGIQYGIANCPISAVLAAGQSLAWHSNTDNQGTYGGGGNGLPYSRDSLGGGWQICFA